MILWLIVLLCGLLGWLGGRSWGHKVFRRVGIPLVLGLFFAFIKAWWLFFAIGGSLALTLPIGYGEPTLDDPKPSFLGLIFRKGWLIRGVYGLIVALSSTWLVYFGFMPFWVYSIYLAYNFTIGTILCILKAPDFIIEPLIYIGIGSIVLLV